MSRLSGSLAIRDERILPPPSETNSRNAHNPTAKAQGYFQTAPSGMTRFTDRHLPFKSFDRSQPRYASENAIRAVGLLTLNNRY
jgi:hypothetical protein